MVGRRALAQLVACGLVTSGLALAGASGAQAACPVGQLTIATAGPAALIVGESISLTAAYCPAGVAWVDVTGQAVFSSDVREDIIRGARLTVAGHGRHLVSATYAGKTSPALRLVAYLDAPQLVEPPRLSNLNPQVDQALSVTSGQWRPAAERVTYQWQANGQAIKGATNATFTPTAALSGTRLAVVVTATAASAINPARVLTAQSEPVTAVAVPPLANNLTDSPLAGLSATVKAKAKAKVTIKILTKKPRLGKKLKVRVTVKAAGVAQSKIRGKVRLKVTGLSRTVTILAKHKAKRTVPLRLKRSGLVTLKVTFLGSATLTKATKTKRLRVAR